jgi:hypothetical protein
VITQGGNVGMGTAFPGDKLDVRGNIRMGTFGELFAAGGRQNLQMLAGRVSAGGATLAGAGFVPGRSAIGTYFIAFTFPMSSTPMVMATPIGSVANDNVITVRSLTTAGFEVHAVNAQGSHAGQHEDTEFSFLVLWTH